jgi:hypothetical protein
MKIIAGISAWLVLIAGLSLLSFGSFSSTSDLAIGTRLNAGLNFQFFIQQDPTPSLPTFEETSEFDLPVAHNPGLVLGAVILVLIIIGGVIINSSLFKKK